MQVSEIINSINDSLAPSLDCLASLLSGLAEPIIRRENGDTEDETKDKYYPAIIDENGECNDVFVDDSYKLGIYHRLNSKSYDVQTTKGFGDSMRNICIAELMLICWGFKSAVSSEDVEALIISKLPKAIKIVSTDFDRKRVFGNEFQGINFFLPPEVFLFAIKYKVQFEVKASCLEINEIFNCDNN